MSGGLNFLAWVKQYKGLDSEHIIIAEFGDQGLEVVGPVLDEWFHNPGREVEY